MQINPSLISTPIFITLFILALLFSVRRKVKPETFSIQTSQELKGLAILAIIFSHIGYFLSTDQNFLFPLSIMAGVGVDIFLFLSGFGLTMSKLKKSSAQDIATIHISDKPSTKSESVLSFYKNKLLKLFIPFWIVLILFLIMDVAILQTFYSWQFTIKAFFGFFTSADIFRDLNSPFWYMTLILFYYLLFPLLFSKKYPWITALILFLATYSIVRVEPEILRSVASLHTLHITAFPIGILFAWIWSMQNTSQGVRRLIAHFLNMRPFFNYIVSGILLMLAGYFAYNSGVGKSLAIAQEISIFTALSFIAFFLIKKFEFRLLTLFGIYSYEIYLLHWPLMYRYDIFYKFFPAWVATVLYLLLFIGLGFLLRKSANKII